MTEPETNEQAAGEPEQTGPEATGAESTEPAAAEQGPAEPETVDALDVMRDFIDSFPDADVFGELAIDYTSNVPNSAGLFPTGLVEVRRRTDLLGNVESDRQANFALYTVLTKAPGDDAGATYNASWLMGLQQWVLDQSAQGLAPTFGDVPEKESMVAQNGQVYQSDEEGWAMYVMQISATFTKRFERS